jgi:hypothetical protein
VVVVKIQHDRQSDGRLGCRQDDCEQGEDLAFKRKCRVESGESHEVDIRAVEHKLDTHEHAQLAEAGHSPCIRVVTVEDDQIIIQEGDNQRAKVPFDQIVEIIDSTRPEKFWAKIEGLGLLKPLNPTVSV